MDKKKEKWLRVLCWAAFIMYVIGLSYLLFFSESYGRTENETEYRYNLVLFQEIKRFIVYWKEIGIKQVVVNLAGNICAFIPFGFCLPIISRPKHKFFYVLISTFFFSLIIETIQLVYKVGSFDVDDLFLNTIGGMLGLLAYHFVRFLFKYKKKEKTM